MEIGRAFAETSMELLLKLQSPDPNQFARDGLKRMRILMEEIASKSNGIVFMLLRK